MTMSFNFRVLMVICGNVASGSEIWKSQYLLNLLLQMTEELTFENLCLQRDAA